MNKFFNIPKNKIVIIAASVALVLIIIMITIICLSFEVKDSGDGADTDAMLDVYESSEGEETSEEPSTESAVESESESEALTEVESETESETESEVVTLPYDEIGLLFEDNGNGTCTVVGIGSCKETELELPERSPQGLSVVGISTGAFENCNKLEKITIPASVKEIGTGAFVGCTSLTAFSVASTNTEYCSVGSVLFSKDKTEMICYPARRAGSVYLLNTNVTKIAPYAFDGVSSLTKLVYRGTIDQFQSITVGIGNNVFTRMPIEFNVNALE